MTTHETYLVKKEAAKIVASAKGIKYQEAFDSIPDSLITNHDHAAIAAEFLSGQTSPSLESLQSLKATLESDYNGATDKAIKGEIKKQLKIVEKELKKFN